MMSTQAPKGGSGRGGRSGSRRGRIFKSRMPILIPHRNAASANYYENKDVSMKHIYTDQQQTLTSL